MVTFTATVAPVSPGAGTPTGTVNFTEGTLTLASSVTLNGSDQATFATALLSVGSHTITAAYSGDTNFTTSTGNDSASPQVVNQASTTTTVGSAPNPSVFGQTVTFTATVTPVSPGAGLPSGTVNFTEGATTLASSVDAQRLRPGDVHDLVAGSGQPHDHRRLQRRHQLQDFHRRRFRLAAGRQPGVYHTTLASAPNPSVSGQTVTFTATVAAVSPGTGTPTGTVNFTEGATTLASGVTLNGSDQATFTISSLAVGSHTITAVYSGDTNFTTSTGQRFRLAAGRQPGVYDNDALRSAPNPFGVRPNSHLHRDRCAGVARGGDADWHSELHRRRHDLGVRRDAQRLRPGDIHYFVAGRGQPHDHGRLQRRHQLQTSTGDDSASPQMVNKASTTTTLGSAPNPSVSGQTITFTATVAPVSPGAGTPTGTVNFTEGATTLASGVTLNGSDQATFTISSLAVGSHTITAVYSGDTNFTTSTGSDSASPQVVNKASTTTAVTSRPTHRRAGKRSPSPRLLRRCRPVRARRLGTVNFTEGATTLASSVTLNGSDQATFTTSSLAVGSHTITAVYSGDATSRHLREAIPPRRKWSARLPC